MKTWQDERREWQEAMLTAARNGDYAELARLMSANCGDKGDIESMIDSFCATVDPCANWREAF